MLTLTTNELLLLIVIPLFVGLLTNFLWESVVRSFLAWTTRSILKLGTLGINRSVNSIYNDIGRKNTHLLDELVMSFLLLVSGIVFGHAIMNYTTANKPETVAYAKSSSQTISLGELIAQKKQLEETINEANLKLAKIEIAIALILVVFMAYAQARFKYVLNSILYFEQVFEILRPYIGEYDHLELISEFRSIKTKLDFTELLEKVTELSKHHQKNIPEFVPL